MDVVEIEQPHEAAILSYDDEAPYEAQLPTEAELAATSLASRIGTNKVYLLEDSSAMPERFKRRQENEEDGAETEEEEMDQTDPNYRPNALLFYGEPISNLVTARLFAYATHFDTRPMGLEWVDDKTCVFLFNSKKDAQDAFSKLTKPTPVATASEDATPMSLDDPLDPEYVAAKPFPVALWPPEERINQTLGKGQGLKGPIRMRWAKVADVKQQGARSNSQFYKKYGRTAGKELFNGRELPPVSEPVPGKRKRHVDDEEENERRRRELDRELDDFLREDEDEEQEDVGHQQKRTKRSERATQSDDDLSRQRPGSPPSKMRSDYIGRDGRTLLDRTSGEGTDLASRLTSPLPRRAGRGQRQRGWGDARKPALGDRIRSNDYEGSGSEREMTRRRDDRRSQPGGGRTGPRLKKTQQELDDELDAFLNAKD